MHLRHPGKTREVATVNAREILGIRSYDLQLVVRGPRHQVAFEHVLDECNLPLEGLQKLVGLPRQGDLDEDDRRHPELSRIQKGDIPADHAGPFEALHPPMTGGRREVHLLGELGIGDSARPLEHPQNAAVRTVEAGINRIFFHFFRLFR